MAYIAHIYCMHHSGTCNGILPQEPAILPGLSLATGAYLAQRWDRLGSGHLIFIETGLNQSRKGVVEKTSKNSEATLNPQCLWGH